MTPDAPVTRLGQEVVGQPFDPRPPGSIVLAAPPQRASPEGDDVKVERDQCATIGRHRVVFEVAGDALLSALSLFGMGSPHAPRQSSGTRAAKPGTASALRR